MEDNNKPKLNREQRKEKRISDRQKKIDDRALQLNVSSKLLSSESDSAKMKKKASKLEKRSQKLQGKLDPNVARENTRKELVDKRDEKIKKAETKFENSKGDSGQFKSKEFDKKERKINKAKDKFYSKLDDADDTRQQDEQDILDSKKSFNQKQEALNLKTQKKAQRKLKAKSKVSTSNIIDDALESEAVSSSGSLEDLDQKLDVARRVKREAKKNKRQQEKAESKAPSILKALKKILPEESVDVLNSLKPIELLKMANKYGLDESLDKKSRNSANNYIETIEKLGVQDYFPQVGRNVATGTFSGARIGSETIYAGGGVLMPQGLYDARKRALKARYGSSQKSLQEIVDFNNVPISYKSDFRAEADKIYNEVTNDKNLSPSEMSQKLQGLNDSAAEIGLVYNSAKSLNEMLMNVDGEGDDIYVPPGARELSRKMINNMNDPGYVEAVLRGEKSIIKDFYGKSMFYRDLISDTEDFAATMKDFEKELPLEAFIDGLTDKEIDDLESLQKTSQSTYSNDVYSKKVKKYFAKDINQLFEDKFGKYGDTDKYSTDQYEQAKRVFTDMMSGSIVDEIQVIATGEGDRQRTAMKKREQENQYIFFEKWEEDLDEFSKTFKENSGSIGVQNSLDDRGEVMDSDNTFDNSTSKIFSVKERVSNLDYYTNTSDYNRAGQGLMVRAVVKGKNKLLNLQAPSGGLNIKALTTAINPVTGRKFDMLQLQDFVDNKKTSKVKLTSQIAAPGYTNSNNQFQGIRADLKNRDSYNNSRNQGVMYQDVGQPVIVETLYNPQTRQYEEQVTSLDFEIQGSPYKGTQARMQELDQTLSSSNKKEVRQ